VSTIIAPIAYTLQNRQMKPIYAVPLLVLLAVSGCGGSGAGGGAVKSGALRLDLTAVVGISARGAVNAMVVGKSRPDAATGWIAGADHAMFGDGHVALQLPPNALSSAAPQFPDGNFTLYLFLDDNGDGKFEAGERGAVLAFGNGMGAIVVTPGQLSATTSAKLDVAAGKSIKDGDNVTCTFGISGGVIPPPGDFGAFVTASAKVAGGMVTLTTDGGLPAGNYGLACSSPYPTGAIGFPYLLLDPLDFNGSVIKIGAGAWTIVA
jgi:hypothetical protein